MSEALKNRYEFVLFFEVENGKAKALVRGEEINSENTLGMWFL